MYRSPEGLNHRFDDSDTDALARIDETLARSRKVVQESIQLTKKSAERKAELEKRLQKSFESFQEEESSSFMYKKPPLSSIRSSSPPYEMLPLQDSLTPSNLNSKVLDSQLLHTDQIKDLQEQLQSEELMKLNFEQALKETRVHLREFETRDREKDLQIQELKRLINKHIDLREPTAEDGKNHHNRSDVIKENKDLKRQIEDLKSQFTQEKARLEEEIENIKREKSSIELQYSNLFNAHSHSSNGSTDLNILQELQFAKDKLRELQNEYARNHSDLKQKLDKQVAENKMMAAKLQSISNGDFDSKVQELEEKLQEQVMINRDLERQMNYLTDRNHPEKLDIREFENQMRKNASKIQELEDKICSTSDKYKDLKTHVSRKLSLEQLPRERVTPGLKKEHKLKRTKPKKTAKERAKSVEKFRKNLPFRAGTPRRKNTPLR